MQNFDTIVIGSGPGGYTAAIKLSQLGFKTALIEKYPALGGACLNVGCIPSKALLDSSEKYHEALADFGKHGISMKNLRIDWEKAIQRKAKIVAENNAGLKYLMKKNKVEVFNGTGQFQDQHTITVTGQKPIQLKAKNFIIATGSKPIQLPNIKIDKKVIITSTECLELKKIPKAMVIIGAGVIGLELGSIYARLGCKVMVVEFMNRIAANFDQQLSVAMQKSLEAIGLEFHLSHKVEDVKIKKNGCIVTATNQDNKKITFEADHCLVAVGRKPYTEELNLNNIDIKLDSKGFIMVNEKLQTNQPHIYAIGDVIGGAMLAHKAEEEAIFVAETIAGQKPHLDHLAIPGVIYTWPEAACIGLTEEQCKEQGIEYNKGVFPLSALGRARASGDTQGFVKIITRKDNDMLLGAHLLCARASDLIAEVAVVYSYKGSGEDLARIIHAHPTFSEAVKESATLAWNKLSVNL